jgi:hypothetical protein
LFCKDFGDTAHFREELKAHDRCELRVGRHLIGLSPAGGVNHDALKTFWKAARKSAS